MRNQWIFFFFLENDQRPEFSLILRPKNWTHEAHVLHTSKKYLQRACEAILMWNQRKLFEDTWWLHQMETFSSLLAICAGISPVTGEFPAQRPATRSFDVFFDVHLNKRLSKQRWGWWFETPLHSLWRHCNDDQRPEFWLILGSKKSQNWASEAHIPHTAESTCNEHVCEAILMWNQWKWPKSRILT